MVTFLSLFERCLSSGHTLISSASQTEVSYQHCSTVHVPTLQSESESDYISSSHIRLIRCLAVIAMKDMEGHCKST